MLQADLFAPALDPRIVLAQPPIVLRDYQEEDLAKMKQALSEGCRRQLLVWATGLGKAVGLAHLPDRLGFGRMLVLAHRKELCDQLAMQLRRANPWAKVGIERAEFEADSNCDMVVGCVPTLGVMRECKKCKEGGCEECNDAGRANKRLARWAPSYFDALLIDEGHHIGRTDSKSGNTYLNIIKYFNAGKPDGPPLFSCTATPFRGDGQSLSNVFEKVVAERTLRWGMTHGRETPDYGFLTWLCDVTARRIKTGADLSRIATRAGDFAEEALADTMNTDLIASKLISAIEDHAADRNSILVTCVNVAHVENLHKQFVDRGHEAVYVTGATRDEDRAERFRRFKDGDARIMLHCNVISEGTDIPNIDCELMARPTKSTLLYTQILGRGTRQSPETGKKNLLVLDAVGVCGKHKIQTAASAFGLPQLDLLGESVLKAVEIAEAAEEAGIQLLDGETLDDISGKIEQRQRLAKGTIRVTTVAQAIDLFAASQCPEEVERESLFPWQKIGEDHYVLPIDRDMRFDLLRDPLGDWMVITGTPDQIHAGRSSGGLRLGAPAEPPFVSGDAFVKKHCGTFTGKDGGAIPKWKAISREAKWRGTAPSDAQIVGLKRMGVDCLPPGLTKGAASEMMNFLMLQKKLARPGTPKPQELELY